MRAAMRMTALVTIVGIAIFVLLELEPSTGLEVPEPTRPSPVVRVALLPDAASVDFVAVVADRFEVPEELDPLDVHHHSGEEESSEDEPSGVALRDLEDGVEAAGFDERWLQRRFAWNREEGPTTYRTIHPDGEVEEFVVVDGERVGRSRRFHKTGELKSEELWSGDARNGLYLEYAESGALVGEGMYADGAKSGAWTTWWPDGTRATHGFFQSGLMAGTWWFWGPDGVLDGKTSGYYVDGQLKEAMDPGNAEESAPCTSSPESE